jgi:predicted Zn-dependent protease
MAFAMQSLPPPDWHHLRAAEGWLELGNDREATAELDRIAPEFTAHPDVLEARWHLGAHAKQWERCVAIANAILKRDPDRPTAWIHRSFALHEARRTQEAFDQLVPVARRFPTVWTIPYNLACYCAQLGRLKESRAWLEQAVALDKATVKRAARHDPDLKPLWEGLGGTL